MNSSKIKEQYQGNLTTWREFQNRFYDLLSSILKPHPFIHKIESRIKSLESIKEKLLRLQAVTLPDIRDIVGFRVIVPTNEDMIKTFRLIESELSIDEARFYEHHSGSLGSHNDGFIESFKYPVSFYVKSIPIDSIFFYAGLNKNRSQLPEWKHFHDCRAEIQIMTVFGQAYMEATHAFHYKNKNEAQIDIPLIDVTSKLNFSVDNFKELLNSSKLHEKKDIHPLIEKNPFLLHPNPDEFFSEVAIGLGTEFKIDFFIRESDGKYLLVEIENPNHAIFTKAGEFSAPLNHALRQVEDWQQWIEDNLPTVQKKYPDMMSPSGLVVIGRSHNLTKEERQRLERRNINLRGKILIWTYDHLINNAQNFIDSIKNNLKCWAQ